MSLFRKVQLCAIFALLSGCKTVGYHSPAVQPAIGCLPESPTESVSYAPPQPAITRTDYEETIPALPMPAPEASAESLLTLSWLIGEVQARNPSLEAMA